MAAVGQLQAMSNGRWVAAKKLVHLSGGFQMPFAVGKPQRTELGNRQAVLDRREHIVKRPAAWIVIMHIIGSSQRHGGLLCQPNESLQLGFVVRSPVKSDGKVTAIGENFFVERETLKFGS